MDAHGLIRQLRELPLAELLGLSREYAEALGEGPEFEARDKDPDQDPGDETGARARGHRVRGYPPARAHGSEPTGSEPTGSKGRDDDLDALL